MTNWGVKQRLVFALVFQQITTDLLCLWKRTTWWAANGSHVCRWGGTPRRDCRCTRLADWHLSRHFPSTRRRRGGPALECAGLFLGLPKREWNNNQFRLGHFRTGRSNCGPRGRFWLSILDYRCITQERLLPFRGRCFSGNGLHIPLWVGHCLGSSRSWTATAVPDSSTRRARCR